MSRPLYLVGGLFLALVVLLVLLPPSAERQPPLSVYSVEPSGGKALRLWLEALGYRVTTIEGGRYQVPPDADTVLLLAPSQPLQTGSLDVLEQRVRGGGRLVVADDSFRASGLLRRFGVRLAYANHSIARAVPAAAGRLDPRIDAVSTDTRTELQLERAPGAEPLLVDQSPGRQSEDDTGGRTADRTESDQPARAVVAAWVPAGRGELIVLTDPVLLGNHSLRNEINARLALSLVGPAGRGVVAFDEVHHGIGAARSGSTYDLLLEQAWGRTLVLAAGIVLVFLLLRGRRFGRAIPVFVDRGRSLGELVTSQAALYRAGGKRAFAAEHLSRQLRQDLAQSVGLPATASDAQIAARAGGLGRDPTRALRVLARAGQARSDGELLALAREGSRARADLVRGGSA